MKILFETFFKLIIGFIIASIGVVMTINSNLGLSPWDVLHQGLSKITPLSIGGACIVVGLTVVLFSMFLGVNLVIGTILNTILMGVFIYWISYLNIIPLCSNFFTGTIMMILGMFLLGIGTYLYMSCGLGCGPRDGLMVALTKITKKPVKMIRAVIELSAMTAGYFLGGFVGIGTIITALGVGYCIQIIFTIFNFNANSIHHKSIKETFLWIKNCISSTSTTYDNISI